MAQQRPIQGELIPLTDDEKALRAPILARLYLELEDMQVDHAEQRKTMAEDERQLRVQIRAVARSIRDGREADQP
jgi:hypothetical protein